MVRIGQKFLLPLLGAFGVGLLLARLIPSGWHESPDSEIAPRISHRQARSDTGKSLSSRELIQQALRAPEEGFVAWLGDHRLDHLGRDERSLIRSLIKERWINLNPAACARFLVSKDEYQLSWYFGRWLEADKEAALAYLDEVRPDQRDRVGTQMAKALASSDPVTAVDVLRKVSSSSQSVCRETLVSISRANRLVLLDFSRDNEEWRDAIITATTAAWLTDDIPWVVRFLEEQSSDLRKVLGGISNFTSEPMGAAIIEKFDQLPPSWVKAMEENGVLIFDAGMAWLEMKSHPSLSQESLSMIQGNAAQMVDSQENGPDNLKHFFSQADWLNDGTRILLARSVVRRMLPHDDEIQKFLKEIPEHLKAEAQKFFDLNSGQTERTQIFRQKRSTSGMMDTLRHQERFPSASDFRGWGQARVNQAAELASQFTAFEAEQTLNNQNWRNLPPEVSASLLERLAPDSELLAKRTSNMASNWAQKSPLRAANWVTGLEVGDFKNQALQSVARQWARYDRKEALSWVESLPRAEQNSIEME